MQRRRATVIANLILSSVLVLGALALAYTAYRSRAYPAGTLNGYMAVLAGGLVLCAASLKLPEVHRQTLALSLVSFVVGGYMLESLLACCTTAPDQVAQRAAAAEAAGLPYDTRSRYEVLIAQRQAGQDIYPAANASQLPALQALTAQGQAILPLGGIAQRLTLHCNETGAYTAYTADEHGFNNPPGLYGTSRIVLLGDSFTHGNCVEPGQDIAGQLRDRDYDVLNLGYSGNGPLLKLATLKEYAAPIKPRLVLWLYYEGNDLADLETEAQNPRLMDYLRTDYSQDLFNRQAEIDGALTNYVEERVAAVESSGDRGWFDTPLARVARFQHFRDRLLALSRLAQRPTPPSPLYAEALERARDETASWGGTLVVVYLPSWRRYAAPDTGRDPFYREEVLATSNALGLPLIDLHQVFVQQPDPLALFPFRLEGHYTAAGYALVASTIDEYLRGPGAWHQ